MQEVNNSPWAFEMISGIKLGACTTVLNIATLALVYSTAEYYIAVAVLTVTSLKS